MPFRETGTQELLERVLAAGGFERTRSVQDAARADHIVLTLGTPSHVHIEIDMSQIRRAVDDLLPVLREGHSLILRSTVAPGTTEWVAGYIEQRRGFRMGEDLFVSHVPERIAANHFVEEIATPAVHHRRSGRGLRSAGGRAVRGVRHGDRSDHPHAGRARQDLDKHPALRPVRAPQPPDDGSRAVRRERVRGDRPDQPRLPARRDGGARADRGRLPAQGLHVLRGALEFAGHAAGGLARARDRAAVPRQGAPDAGWAGRSGTARWPCWG